MCGSQMHSLLLELLVQKHTLARRRTSAQWWNRPYQAFTRMHTKAENSGHESQTCAQHNKAIMHNPL